MEKVAPRYQWYAHCERLAAVLQRVADGELRRVMIFLPPRHSKSESVSRLFSAYYLRRYPARWVGLASYGAELAYTLSRAARDNYRTGGGPLRDDADAVKHWETPQGGGLWAAGVGGPITGRGWNLGLIDDPLKNAEEAASETIREKQREWYRSTFSTREEPGNSAIVIINTRWHMADLSGWLLAEEDQGTEAAGDHAPERWHVVNLPALAEEPPALPATCTLEPDDRLPGEALCPERYDAARLAQIRSRIGEYWWSSLYQQRPASREGLFFQVSQLEVVPAAPAGLRQVRAWDIAATADSGNYTAGVKIGTDGAGRFWVLDVARGQWATHDRDRLIRQTAALDGPTVSIRLPQDPGAAGKSQGEAFVRLLAGYPVQVAPVSGDKSTRADPFSSQVNAGNVRLVAGSWNRALVEELRAFPTGTYSDQVDAAADSFNALSRARGYEVT